MVKFSIPIVKLELPTPGGSMWAMTVAPSQVMIVPETKLGKRKSAHTSPERDALKFEVASQKVSPQNESFSTGYRDQ
jgi:hypothetical protein